MSTALYRLGRFAARHPWRMIAIWIAASALVIGASGAFGKKLEDSFAVPGIDSQQATDLLTAAGSGDAGLTAQVVLTPEVAGDTFASSAAARSGRNQIEAGLRALPKVVAASTEISADGRVAAIRVQYPVLERLDHEDLVRLNAFLADVATDSPLRIEAGGDLFAALEEAETGPGEIAGLFVGGLILLIAFGSFIAMGLPIGVALFGLAVGISSMSLIAYLIDVPSWAPVIGSMVGLGVGIDYALFLLTRHREYLARGLSVEESVGRAVATAGKVVVFAGGTVVIAILGLAVAGVPFMTAAGVAVAAVVGVMVAASITLLPAFLGLAGERLSGRRFLRGRPRDEGGEGPGPGWQRWVGHVSRNAWAYAIGATLLLVAMAAPVLALRVGNPDEGTLPESRTERQAYDLVADGFGAGANGPLVIAVDLAGDPGAIAPLRQAVAADDGIAAVAPAEIDRAAGVATLLAQPDDRPAGSGDRRDDRPVAARGPAASRSPAARPVPMSAAGPRASPTSAAGSTIACRCSSPLSSASPCCC